LPDGLLMGSHDIAAELVFEDSLVILVQLLLFCGVVVCTVGKELLQIVLAETTVCRIEIIGTGATGMMLACEYATVLLQILPVVLGLPVVLPKFPF